MATVNHLTAVERDKHVQTLARSGNHEAAALLIEDWLKIEEFIEEEEKHG